MDFFFKENICCSHLTCVATPQPDHAPPGAPGVQELGRGDGVTRGPDHEVDVLVSEEPRHVVSGEVIADQVPVTQGGERELRHTGANPCPRHTEIGKCCCHRSCCCSSSCCRSNSSGGCSCGR